MGPISMMKRDSKKLLSYYSWGIPSIICVSFLLAFIEIELIDILYYISGFSWNYALNAPKIRKKVAKYKYRFSFIKFLYKFNRLLDLKILVIVKNKFNSPTVLKLYYLHRIFIPVLFLLIIFLISGLGNPLYALLGSLIFEVLYFLLIKNK